MSWPLSSHLIIPVSPVFGGVFLMVFNHSVLFTCVPSYLVCVCVCWTLYFLNFLQETCEASDAGRHSCASAACPETHGRPRFRFGEGTKASVWEDLHSNSSLRFSGTLSAFLWPREATESKAQPPSSSEHINTLRTEPSRCAPQVLPFCVLAGSVFLR